VWLLVLAVELVHGTLRWIFLRPRVGDFRSGQIGVFTGSVLFLVMVYFCERWMTFAKLRGWLARWTALGNVTLACEWNFGHYLMGRSWAGTAAEYNLLQGWLSGFVGWQGGAAKAASSRRTPNSHGTW